MEPKSFEAKQSALIKLFAYLGGIFVFAGMSIYIGTFWIHMSSLTKIILTLGTGLLLYIFALFSFYFYPKHSKIITPLFLVAAFFETVGLFVTLDEFHLDTNLQARYLFIFGVLLIQQLLTFWKTESPVLIFTALFFGSGLCATALNILDIDHKISRITIGLLLLSITYLLDRAKYRNIASFWYFIGAVVFLSGLFESLRHSTFEWVFFGISCIMLYLSTVVRSKTLLFVSTLSAICYIAYFTHQHFMQSATWPILLVLLGFIFFGIGILFIKISKKF